MSVRFQFERVFTFKYRALNPNRTAYAKMACDAVMDVLNSCYHRILTKETATAATTLGERKPLIHRKCTHTPGLGWWRRKKNEKSNGNE